ncbi:hypothetical protein MKZ38_007391 [Zalerion maritima]|uniref:HTH APSES-type domain-containing protein n=1 Tax=Zalerion maritima TaxID=339359 RepID=A0AAD5WP67_9PEZI|nr:hypothetical protein MKZ38_007391 [Zalerion maritima]
MVKPNTGPGIYSATYSGIPVYEFQFGDDLKEHVMRRRQDDWINATHILKAAGFDKPARTRILEREVQKDTHEKIQGGYGKYQGTWIPLEYGQALAQRNSVYDRLHPIFEFIPGNESPPPAPRHTSKPKAPRKPAVPKWGSKLAKTTAASKKASIDFSQTNQPQPQPQPQPPIEEYDNGDSQMGGDDTPDNITVASVSYMAEDDRYDLGHHGTGHRKRKREEPVHDMTEQQHSVYGDELLDYFLLSRNKETTAFRPEPPPNFQPDWVIDTEDHTALHWASAMGDVDVIKQLKRFGATLAVHNTRGETPFMRSVNFTNCYEKETFPAVMKELFETVDAKDNSGCTVIHHAAVMKSGRVTSHSCSRYYLDNILNRLLEIHEPTYVQQLIDAPDNEGNTALHLAAQRNARKCIRALLGRNASTDIPNHEGIRAEDVIKELNANKSQPSRGPHRSSSPFGPDSQRHASFRDALALSGQGANKLNVTFRSDAANSIQSQITPLLLSKLQVLSSRYDEEVAEIDNAEADARRILAATQVEEAAVQKEIAEQDSMLEPDDSAAKTAADACTVQAQVLSLVAKQNRVTVAAAVETELNMLNGDAGADDGPEQQAQLIQELQHSIAAQEAAEREYVNALGAVGTGDQIEKYRRLLKLCLDQTDADSLDTNLDALIDMMQEEAHDVPMGVDPSGTEHQRLPTAPDPMDIGPL